jgi:hypothetical protein
VVPTVTKKTDGPLFEKPALRNKRKIESANKKKKEQEKNAAMADRVRVTADLMCCTRGIAAAGRVTCAVLAWLSSRGCGVGGFKAAGVWVVVTATGLSRCRRLACCFACVPRSS